MNNMKEVDIIKIKNETMEKLSDTIIVEDVLNINVNRKFYASLMCTPEELLQLALGFLFSEGVITSMKSVRGIEEKDENTLCIILRDEFEPKVDKKRTLTSGCVGGSIDLSFLEEKKIKPIVSDCKYSVNQILMLMKEFNSSSNLFKQTGGVHSCAICSHEGTVFFSEDIGRHNALDKVVGKSIIKNVELSDKLLMTTGRISSDITLKAARAGIPIIVSHSAPTDLALNFAKASNMTMIGFARGNRMNLYWGEDRILI
ncbi:MAG: formate dehydrogenase family accessory protein FdhD [Clostridiales bacterium]|jgi:FdhD protein|nr:formate dehydrogenase family accessory protein FdhD [Clostridiales bacterium]